ncbi:MAG: phosphonate ABC transporter ATP-binding protein [Candidatus Methylomirabilales bacterium]
MYRAEKLTKVFDGGLVAVDQVDLEIERGEKIAFIGPSGAGKTTLFRMLNLTIPPTTGRLFFDGQDTRSLRGRKLRGARRRIGTIYQQHNLVPRLKVVHNVLAGRLGSWSTGTAFFSLIRPTEVELAYGALQRVGIPEKLFARTDELSGGQQQRVAIARVLVQDPEVILADEPVSSVDPTLASAIVKLLVEISLEAGKTLLMNLHSTDLALQFFPRVIGIRGGQVLFDLKPAEVTAELLERLYSGSRSELEGGLINESPNFLPACRLLPRAH